MPRQYHDRVGLLATLVATAAHPLFQKLRVPGCEGHLPAGLRPNEMGPRADEPPEPTRQSIQIESRQEPMQGRAEPTSQAKVGVPFPSETTRQGSDLYPARSIHGILELFQVFKVFRSAPSNAGCWVFGQSHFEAS